MGTARTSGGHHANSKGPKTSPHTQGRCWTSNKRLNSISTRLAQIRQEGHDLDSFFRQQPGQYAHAAPVSSSDVHHKASVEYLREQKGWRTLLPDLALWKLRAETAEACPKLLALVKLSSRPAGSANVSSLSLGRPLELAGAFLALVKDPAMHIFQYQYMYHQPGSS